MANFGWSLPAGTGKLPGEEETWSEHFEASLSPEELERWEKFIDGMPYEQWQLIEKIVGWAHGEGAESYRLAEAEAQEYAEIKKSAEEYWRGQP